MRNIECEKCGAGYGIAGDHCNMCGAPLPPMNDEQEAASVAEEMPVISDDDHRCAVLRARMLGLSPADFRALDIEAKLQLAADYRQIETVFRAGLPGGES